jgi:hypothetical protein
MRKSGTFAVAFGRALDAMALAIWSELIDRS